MKKILFAVACLFGLGIYAAATDTIEAAKAGQDGEYGSALGAIQQNLSALKAGKAYAAVPVISETSLAVSEVSADEKAFGGPGQPGGHGSQPGQPGGPGHQQGPVGPGSQNPSGHSGTNPGHPQQPSYPTHPGQQPNPGMPGGYQPQPGMGQQDLGTCNGSDSGWEEHWLGHTGNTPAEACKRCREKHGSCNYTCSKPMYVCTAVFQPQQQGPNGAAPREYNGYASPDYYNAQRSATANCTQGNWGVPGQCSIKGCNQQNITTAQGQCR